MQTKTQPRRNILYLYINVCTYLHYSRHMLTHYFPHYRQSISLGGRIQRSVHACFGLMHGGYTFGQTLLRERSCINFHSWINVDSILTSDRGILKMRHLGILLALIASIGSITGKLCTIYFIHLLSLFGQLLSGIWKWRPLLQNRIRTKQKTRSIRVIFTC